MQELVEVEGGLVSFAQTRRVGDAKQIDRQLFQLGVLLLPLEVQDRDAVADIARK